MTLRARAVAYAADLLCIVVFAVAGRQSHEPGEAVSVVAAIAWPYALAALLAHLSLLAAGRRSDTLRLGGLAVVVVTYAIGMTLRGLSGRGLATGFLVVAAIFLTMTMLGWRLALSAVRRRRRG